METSSSATYKETHTVRQQTTTTVGVIDRRYFQDGFGIIKFALKVIEVLGLLVAFICVIVSIPCAGHPATFEYFKGISVFFCITTTILFFFLLFQLQVRLLRCDCCIARWPLFELMYYFVVVIFLLFANIFLSLHGCLAGHKAGVVESYNYTYTRGAYTLAVEFFGWVAFAAFGLDTLIAFYYYCKSCRSGSSESSSKTTTTTTSAVPDDAKY